MSVLNIKKISEHDDRFKIIFTFEDYIGIKYLKQICLGLVYKRVLLGLYQENYDNDSFSKKFIEAFKNLAPQIPDFPLVIKFDKETSTFSLSSENEEDLEDFDKMLEG